MTGWHEWAYVLLAAILVGSYVGALACRRGLRTLDRILIETREGEDEA